MDFLYYILNIILSTVPVFIFFNSCMWLYLTCTQQFAIHLYYGVFHIQWSFILNTLYINKERKTGLLYNTVTIKLVWNKFYVFGHKNNYLNVMSSRNSHKGLMWRPSWTNKNVQRYKNKFFLHKKCVLNMNRNYRLQFFYIKYFFSDTMHFKF